MDAGAIADDQTLCYPFDADEFTSETDGSGDGDITYQWMISTDGCDEGFSNISGATNSTYDHGTVSVETYFRRITISTLNGVACADTSNCVTVTPNWVDAGTIEDDQVLCAPFDAEELTSVDEGDGAGDITYQWISSTDSCNGGFSSISGATNESYDPGTVSVETYFRRITTSTLNDVACADTSNCVTITPNDVDAPTITGGATICYGDSPGTFEQTQSGSGDGDISYQWQSALGGCNGNFSNINGATNGTYNPGAMFTSTSFRVIIISTINGVECKDTSNCISVGVLHVTSGEIGYDDTLCACDTARIVNVTSGTCTGTGVHYYWLFSNVSCDGTTWTRVDADQDYYDTAVCETTYIRRVAFSVLNGHTCYDTTDCVTITINDVDAGEIANDQTLCYPYDAEAFTSVEDGSGDGDISYQWIISTDGCDEGFSPINGATNSTYDHGTVSQTTYFRRVTISSIDGEECTDTSNCVMVELNEVDAGAIAEDQTLCYPYDPDELTSDEDGTGTGTITYQWLVSEDSCNGGFSAISGATNESYDPGAVSVETYFRRVAISTYNGVACADTSDCVTISLNEVSAAVIGDDQTVCEDENPGEIEVTTAATGSNLTYQWLVSEDSCNADNFTAISGATTTSYDPPILDTTTYYRLVVTSTVNGVTCTDTTNCVTVFVNKVNPGTIGGDSTLCNGDSVLIVSIEEGICTGDKTYQWVYTTGPCDDVSGYVIIQGATQADLGYVNPDTTTRYLRLTTSFLNGVACSEYSNCVEVTINEVEVGVVGDDHTICLGDVADELEMITAPSATGDLSYQWQSADDCEGTFSNISGATNDTYEPGAITSTTSYRLILTSSVNGSDCHDTSNCVTVTVNEVDPGEIGYDQTLCAPFDPDELESVEDGSGNGEGSISYQWIESTDSCNGGFSNISGATDATYDPGEISQTTHYRRITIFTYNGVSCYDTSNCVTATINWIDAGAIADDQILCAPFDPDELTSDEDATGAGTIAYQWVSMLITTVVQTDTLISLVLPMLPTIQHLLMTL